MRISATQYKIKRLREGGKHAANTRWMLEARRRERLAELDPIRVGGKIIERWIRIIGEVKVKERTVYEFDLASDKRRKRRELFA